MKPLDRKVLSPRKPSSPRYAGIHGGSIDTWDEYNRTPQEPEHARAQVENSSSPAPAKPDPREAEFAAFEAVLSRSEYGRRALT